MHQLFLSHSEDDYAFIRDLAHNLEGMGFRCWYFERDTIAGRSYLAQVAEGIRGAQALVLIVSPASLKSNQVTKEVEQAHQRERPIIPILLNASGNDIEQRQPSWFAAMATTAWIDASLMSIEQVANELKRGIESLGIKAEFPNYAVAPADDRLKRLAPRDVQASGVIWATDGNQIEIPLLKDVIFQTPVISEFLNSDQKFFLSANKGLGKTLLMRYKRSLLAHRYYHVEDQQRTGHPKVHFIPEGRPYLDLMSDLPSISKGHDKFLSLFRNCKRTWSFAMRVSALSHFPDLVGSERVVDTAMLPPRLSRWLNGTRVEPTVVFRELISFPLSELNRILDQFENTLEFVFRNIHSGVFMFIDKVDQGLRSISRDAWVNVQGGLIDAAWDVMGANGHVKVYATLREEAYANYGSETKANAYGATSTLRYSLDDLSQLIDKLTRFYEGVPTFLDFVQHHAVRNQRGEVVEDTFRYLHRHTIGRPRDLVIVCSEISRRHQTLTESLLRNVVNSTASEAIVPNVFDEMHVVLDCLRDRNERHKLWKQLPHNILSNDEVSEIVCKFNGVDLIGADAARVPRETFRNPFCELYECGLLGVIRDDLLTGRAVQQFKQPHDVAAEWSSSLPDSRYYLLHPALQSLIHSMNGGGGYRVFRYIVVGHGYEWRESFSLFIDVQRELFRLKDREAVLAVEDFLTAVHASYSENRVQPRNWDDYGATDVRPMLEARGYEDLYLVIDQLLDELPTVSQMHLKGI